MPIVYGPQNFWNKVIANKVPEITLSFWVIKLLTTGMGETTSDFLAKKFDPPIVVGLTGATFVLALIFQLSGSRFQPLLYWVVVVLVSIFGTMVADVIHVALGAPYLASTICFAAMVCAIFWAWWRQEGTLDVGLIDTRRRELYYWALVVASFALGTAIGDLVASTFKLGFLSSALLFSAAIIPPAVMYWRSVGTAIAPFWWTYVLTRPVGASFADWMGVDASRGGLDWGTGPVSFVLGILILALTLTLGLRQRGRAIPATLQ